MVRKKALVVCGYGCHLTLELCRYLDRVALYILRDKPDVLVLCGGFTQRKSATGKSEAGVMREYLKKRIPTIEQTLLETDSYTTVGNIRGAKNKLVELSDELVVSYDVTIFCEATRALKTAMLARYFFGFPPADGHQPIRIETDSWELMHPVKELIGTIEVLISLYIPILDRFFTRSRITRAERI